MSNKTTGFKKTLKRAMVLLLVVVLTTGAVSVMGTDATDYQPDNSNDLYVAAPGDLGEGEYEYEDSYVADEADYGYEYDYEYDASYEEGEAGAVVEEAPAVISPAQVDINALGTAMPVPFGAPTVDAYTWDDINTAVQDHIGEEVIILLRNDIVATGNAIVIPAGTSVYLMSALFGENAYAVYQHNVTSTNMNFTRRHFVIEGGSLSLGNVHLTRNTAVVDMDAEIGGGIRIRNDGYLYMFAGSAVSNVRSSDAGAVWVELGSTLEMHGGDIHSNISAIHGGGIGIWNSNFTMYAGTIRNNVATQVGGGVRVDTGAIFTMHGGLITDNQAGTHAGGLELIGNAIFTMYGGAITENEATNAGGGINVGAGATATMHGGEISGNVAGTHSGGVVINNGSLTIHGGTISNNEANTHAGGVGLIAANSTFTMTGGTIGGDTPAYANTAVNGGGVWVGNGATFTMNGADAVIRGNVAAETGGGVRVQNSGSTFTMYNGAISHNHGGANSGGVIVSEEAVFTMYDGRIHHNTAGGSGGGVNVNSLGGTGIGGWFVMRGGVIDYNSTGSGGGGGGGVRVFAGTFTMYDGVIRNNAGNIGGGVSVREYFYMHGGAIYGNTTTSRGGGVALESSLTTMTMTGGIIGGDTPAHANTAAWFGGGVAASPGATFVMDGADALIRGNRATDGGGAGISGSTFTMLDGTIYRNEATNGGGVWIAHSATFTMDGTDAVIRRNTATGTGTNTGGGGVFATGAGSTFNMYVGTIQQNESTTWGGGVQVTHGANFTMHDGIIADNVAHGLGGGHGGGGISIRYDSSLIMYGGQVLNNRAEFGGGLRVGGASAQISETNPSVQTLFYGNTAVRSGGGLHMTDSDGRTGTNIVMTGGTIENNEAGVNGGGAQIGSASFTISGTTLIYNNTANNGGGVNLAAAYPGVFTMNGGLIIGNTAGNNGGGVAVQNVNATMTATAGSITNNHAALDGGGIFTIAYDYNHTLSTGAYSNLTISPAVIFGGNTAGNGAFLPPTNPQITNIAFPATGNGPSAGAPGLLANPVQNHTLNNYDINFFVREVAITKSAPATVTPNTALTYTLTITNTGNVTLTGLAVTDNLPAQLTNPRNLQYPTGVTASFTGQTLSATIASLAPGASVTIAFTVTVNASVGQTITNTATVTVPSIPGLGDEGSTTTTVVQLDEGGGNNGGGDPTPNPAVQITKSAPATVQPNTPLTYTITVRNTGDVTLTGLVVTDNLPAQLQNPRNLQYPAGVTASFTGQTLNATIASLNPGQTVTISFVVTVYAAVGTAITNTATVNVPSMPGIGDQGSTTTTVTGNQPEMIKNPDRTVVRVGETIYWTLRGFHNPTGVAVTDFMIMDMPGRGLNFLSGSLPAFTGGEGITFDIRYTVAGSNQWHTHATGIDASQPFNFSLPQPGNLHYTNIALFFGDVPADFGLGNEIVLTFVVGADAPNNVLINEFLIRYNSIERPGLSPDRPIVVPDDSDNGGSNVWTPITPQLPTTPEQPDETDNAGAQLPGLGVEANENVPQVTPATDAETSPAIGRVNPPTGDNFNLNGIILSVAGLVASLGALLLVGKSRRKNAA